MKSFRFDWTCVIRCSVGQRCEEQQGNRIDLLFWPHLIVNGGMDAICRLWYSQMFKWTNCERKLFCINNHKTLKVAVLICIVETNNYAAQRKLTSVIQSNKSEKLQQSQQWQHLFFVEKVKRSRSQWNHKYKLSYFLFDLISHQSEMLAFPPSETSFSHQFSSKEVTFDGLLKQRMNVSKERICLSRSKGTKWERNVVQYRRADTRRERIT